MDNHFNLEDLNRFTGSEQFYRHCSNKKMIYTEGVQYLIEQVDCYWLVDEIANILLPRVLKLHQDWFYLVTLFVHHGCSATITVEDGSGANHVEHKIKWTDFPIIGKPIMLYLCESGDRFCLMLPREY